ncbi:MAG: S-layer homology domain-containing protein, partial [Clostridia bacterium]|nr:S-layer homology domain-containing protein [Clostridia bacterium]
PGINFSVIHLYEEPYVADDTLNVDKDVKTADKNGVSDETADEEETMEAESVAEEVTEEVTEEAIEGSEEEETAYTEDSAIINEEETEASDQEKNDDTEYDFNREELPVSYFNKYPTEWGAYLLDETFSSSTKSVKPSLEIVITLDSPDMHARAGQSIWGTVSAIYDNATDTPIEPGTVVISVCETSSYRGNYHNIAVGNRMLISFQVAQGWENVHTAIGGSDLIVTDGQVNNDAIDEAHEKVANPRTAVGVREDGTVIFFAIDGRSDESFGMRMVSLAKTLISFGCVTAMNLDGGGSTTAVVKYPGDESASVINVPSDSAERAVSNALLLISEAVSDGIPRYIVPDDTEPVILPGESYTFDGYFCDASLSKVNLDPENEFILTADDVKIEFDMSRLSYYTDETMPDLGSISEDGKVYTASGITGEIPLLFTASYKEETLTGRVILFVAPAPDTVNVALGSSVYSPADGFDIEFDAYYMNKPVPAKPEHLTYTLTDNEVKASHTINEDDSEIKLADSSVGRITEDGRFVPYPDADGSVWLTVALGGIPMSQTLIVCQSPYVTALIEKEIVYDFPSVEDTSIVSETDTAVSNETENITEPTGDTIPEMPAKTEVPYDGAITETTVFESELPLENASSLDLYASDSDLELFATVNDLDGNEYRITYVKQMTEPENNGMFHYRAALDKKYASVSEILVFDAEANAGRSGIFKLDKAEISFDDTETVFYDTYNHWARKSINTLFRDGIVGGEEYDGRMRFAPDRSLSRAEFAVIISRSLGYDTSAYTSDPEFDDIGDIPAWALPYVRAVSENGIMNGKDMPDGKLCFDPTGSITRQEIMQVMGNIIKKRQEQSLIEAIANEASEQAGVEASEVPAEQPEEITDGVDIVNDTVASEFDTESVLFGEVEGEASVYEMPPFTDAGEVAAWAYENVLLTLEAGIITGYEDNTLRPARNVTRAEAATVVLRAQNYLSSTYSVE